MNHPESSGENPVPEPEPVRGLADPRTIHPGPEGIFDDGAGSSDAGPPPEPGGGGSPADDGGPGIVDPRSETAGPDL